MRYGQYAVGAFLVEGKAPLPWDGLYAVATPGRSFGMAYNIGNVQLQPGAPRPAHGSRDGLRRGGPGRAAAAGG